MQSNKACARAWDMECELFFACYVWGAGKKLLSEAFKLSVKKIFSYWIF